MTGRGDARVGTPCLEQVFSVNRLACHLLTASPERLDQLAELRGWPLSKVVKGEVGHRSERSGLPTTAGPMAVKAEKAYGRP